MGWMNDETGVRNELRIGASQRFNEWIKGLIANEMHE